MCCRLQGKLISWKYKQSDYNYVCKDDSLSQASKVFYLRVLIIEEMIIQYKILLCYSQAFSF